VTRQTANQSVRRNRRLALLILPALLLRALIPAGFMPFAGTGGAYLGFCPGAGDLPPQMSGHASHAGHGTHEHPDGGAPGAPSMGHHPACVFSAGAGATLAATPTAVLESPLVTAPTQSVASLTFLPAIQRAQSSRGPPLLA
jgi:hypothetical protein